MNVALALICFVSLTLGCATLVTQGGERAFLRRTVLTAWVGFVPLVAFINEWLAFTGGGDDEDYYRLAATPIYSLADALDLTRFTDAMEQPGYPWLLSLLNYCSGQDLLVFKLLNLTLFILLSIVWYRIGTLLESPIFGRAVAVGILLLTPLWFYTWFLLKDMTIALLQSLFLLGVVGLFRGRSLRHWALIGGATFALFPFRTFLVLQNATILLASLMLLTLTRERISAKTALVIMGGGVVVVLLAIGSNVEIMASLGVNAEDRVLGSWSMLEKTSIQQESSLINRTLFPLIYLFSETSGLKPETWTQLDAFWLRGALSLPWILFFVPFFLLGAAWLTLGQHAAARGNGFLERMRNSRLVATPWGVLVLFVLSYIAFSWQAGDTTRWRIPDMPVIATIAVAGWRYAALKTREIVLLLWIGGGGLLFSMFYILKDS
jgi:hypothetical protein